MTTSVPATMLRLCALCLCVGVSLGLMRPDFGLLSDEEIHYVNNVAKTTWKVRFYSENASREHVCTFVHVEFSFVLCSMRIIYQRSELLLLLFQCLINCRVSKLYYYTVSFFALMSQSIIKVHQRLSFSYVVCMVT